MNIRVISWLAIVALALLARGQLAAAQPVFNGDPIDPTTGQAYMLLPGLPLVYPGPDGRYGTADDIINPAIVGDVDLVLRTGGAFSGGAIPPTSSSVAAAPLVIAGGRDGNAGTQAPFQLIISDGSAAVPAGHPLLGPELNNRRALIVAYADLDGDGFIGPTATSAPADIEIQRQEALTFAGRTMAEIQNGVASGLIGVAMGAPGSTGGLGIVVAGGAATGATPNLYADGPWIATSLPYMIPLNQAQIVGGEPTGPIDPIALVDLELTPSGIYLPPPNNPLPGAPYAIALDGSNVTVDLLRSNAGTAVGAEFARPIDRSTFVAQWGRVVRPAVNGLGQRDLVESVDALSLPADGPGNAQTLVVFPADLFGNPTDPPSGGFAVTLAVGPGLRIVSPDSDGDPRSETIVFGSPASVTVTIDDAGIAHTATVTDRLLALHNGVPSGMVAFAITPGPGGGAGVLQALSARVRHAGTVGQDRLHANAAFTASPSSINPVTQSVSIVLSSATGTFYQRVLPAGSFQASTNGANFTFSDSTTRVAIRRSTSDPGTQVVKLRAAGLNLSAVPRTLGTLSVAVEVGAATYQGTASCTTNAAGRVTRCGP